MKIVRRKLKKKPLIILISSFLGLILLICFINNIIYRNSYEYKFKKIGYTESEVKIFLEEKDKKRLDSYLKLNKNPNIPKLIDEKYFIYANLSRYLEYMKAEKKDSKETVSIVNVSADKDWYTDVVDTNMGKDYLMLVNRYNKLKDDYEPKDLVLMTSQYAYQNKKIRTDVFDAFMAMADSAYEKQLVIVANNTYRSYKSQKEVYDYNEDINGEEYTDKIIAKPGHSEHQTGLAIDVDAYGQSINFEETEEFKWMKKNAHKYGFILRYPKGKEKITGFDYEPWHFRYVGVKVATEIYNRGITFDEYYNYFLK